MVKQVLPFVMFAVAISGCSQRSAPAAIADAAFDVSAEDAVLPVHDTSATQADTNTRQRFDAEFTRILISPGYRTSRMPIIP